MRLPLPVPEPIPKPTTFGYRPPFVANTRIAELGLRHLSSLAPTVSAAIEY